VKKEAYYYKIVGESVQCLLCPHFCILTNGQTGICLARKHENGKLIASNYSRICSFQNDPIEKKPLFHFLPGSKSYSFASAGCNLKCLNCQNSSISQNVSEIVESISLTPEKVVELALKSGSQSISYTYTEPLVSYEFTIETARLARKAGLKNCIISAGFINPQPMEELCSYIDAANIDLKVFDDSIYKKLNKASLFPILETLKMLKQKNIWLEITNLLIPEWTDNLETVKKMCDWLIENRFEETPLHFSRFFPRNKLLNINATSEDLLINAREIAIQAGIKYVYVGNIKGNHNLENTYCPNCKNLLLHRHDFSSTFTDFSHGKCVRCGTSIRGVWQ